MQNESLTTYDLSVYLDLIDFDLLLEEFDEINKNITKYDLYKKAHLLKYF